MSSEKGMGNLGCTGEVDRHGIGLLPMPPFLGEGLLPITNRLLYQTELRRLDLDSKCACPTGKDR